MITTHLLNSYPWRPVDARYHRALEIVHHDQRALGRDGRKTAEVVKFLRRLSLCRTESDTRQLLNDMPSVYLAVEFYQEAPFALRSTLEARLLADEPTDSIAQKMCVMESVITTYADIFFDVGDRRECLDFVVERVIGRPDKESSGDEVDASLKKTVSYLAGWRALDAYLYPGAASDTSGLARLEEILALRTKGWLRNRAALALERLQVGDPASARELLKSFRAAPNTNEDNQTSTLERHIAAMLDELPWVSGKLAREILPAELVELDDLAAELHDDELMLIAAGQRDPEVIAEIHALTFPPSRTAATDSDPSSAKQRP